MLKNLLILTFYASAVFNLHADFPTYISLGDACGPCLMLRTLGLRGVAYPFDWVVSPLGSLHAALEDDFEFFLQELTVREDRTGVADKYGFNFTHDWPTINDKIIDPLQVDFVWHAQLADNWETAVPLAREKYQRRIERFREMCLGSELVFFLRDNLTKEEAITLRDLIEKKYPTLDFVLIAFRTTPEYTTDWHLDKIRSFYSTYQQPDEFKKCLDKIAQEFGKSNER